MVPGIHLLHKPIGVTSFSLVRGAMDAVARDASARRAHRRVPRVCHGGTLDPFSSGLLLILIEPATRLFDDLHSVPKTYRGIVRWGVETDNGDPLGKVVSTGDASMLRPERLEEALQAFIGWQEQVPPATSAKRVGGERAYEKAHRGEVFSLPPSRVYLHAARWLSHDLPHASELEVVVRGGYYVRSLARDLGRMLGCGAHLRALNRSAIGPWSDPGLGREVQITGSDVLPWAPLRDLTDQEVGELRAGRAIARGALRGGEWRVPEGFPDPDPPIRGMHQGRFRFILRAAAPTERAAPMLMGRSYEG